MELAAVCVFRIYNASYPDLLHPPVHRVIDLLWCLLINNNFVYHALQDRTPSVARNIFLVAQRVPGS